MKWTNLIIIFLLLLAPAFAENASQTGDIGMIGAPEMRWCSSVPEMLGGIGAPEMKWCASTPEALGALGGFASVVQTDSSGVDVSITGNLGMLGAFGSIMTPDYPHQTGDIGMVGALGMKWCASAPEMSGGLGDFSSTIQTSGVSQAHTGNIGMIGSPASVMSSPDYAMTGDMGAVGNFASTIQTAGDDSQTKVGDVGSVADLTCPWCLSAPELLAGLGAFGSASCWESPVDLGGVGTFAAAMSISAPQSPQIGAVGSFASAFQTSGDVFQTKQGDIGAIMSMESSNVQHMVVAGNIGATGRLESAMLSIGEYKSFWSRPTEVVQ